MTKFDPAQAILGAIISTYTAGGAVGCLLSAPIGNRFGRRGTMRIGVIVAVVGTTLQTAAQNVEMLIIGRLVAGLAIGIIYFAIPQYQSEIAPPAHRGSIIGLHAQFIGFGYAISNWVGFGVSFGSGQFTVSATDNGHTYNADVLAVRFSCRFTDPVGSHFTDRGIFLSRKPSLHDRTG